MASLVPSTGNLGEEGPHLPGYSPHQLWKLKNNFTFIMCVI